MKRRDLLKAGVLTTTGLKFARSFAACSAEEKGGELRVALIGVGTQGRELIRSSLLDPGIRFAAVCDIWEYARRYGELYLKNFGHGVNSYADYREMLEKETDLDAVLVASPDFAHLEHSAACLKIGVNTYLETPMSSSLEEARALVREVQGAKALLQVGYQRRSDPRYLHIRDVLLTQANLPGRITHVNASWIHPLESERGWPRRQEISEEGLRQAGYESMSKFRNWRWYRPYCGGLFPNLGAHQVDVMCWFLGVPPKRVMASGGSRPDDDRWHENVMALLDFEVEERIVQASGQVLTTTRGDGSGSYEHFFGTQGSILTGQGDAISVVRDPDAPEWDEWVRKGFVKQPGRNDQVPLPDGQKEVSETRNVSPFEVPVTLDTPPCFPHLSNFFDAIRGKAKLNCPAELALATEVAVHKVSEAVESRREVSIPESDLIP